MHPTQLHIDLDAIRHNVRLIRSHVGARVRVMAVVKANAYGHGAAQAARAAVQAGASWIAVATLPEALALRDSGISTPILATGYTPVALAREAIAHDIRVTLYDHGVAEGFARAAVTLQRPCFAHIKIDSGMGRLGIMPDQARAFAAALRGMPGMTVEGMFTHFSCSESDPDRTRQQLALFQQATDGEAVLRHACNSGGVFGHPEAHLDMVRPGLAIYGMSPYAPAEAPLEIVRQLRPALRWRSEIVSVKTLPDGAPVGYGARYRCVGERVIAVVPVGYGDGLRRTPHNVGELLVHGQRASICGTVCMDQCMIDVTHIPNVHIGDEVVLIGAQGFECISAEAAADRLGTINYEITTALLARSQRIYLNEGT
jgi:alanine racemase